MIRYAIKCKMKRNSFFSLTRFASSLLPLDLFFGLLRYTVGFRAMLVVRRLEAYSIIFQVAHQINRALIS